MSLETHAQSGLARAVATCACYSSTSFQREFLDGRTCHPGRTTSSGAGILHVVAAAVNRPHWSRRVASFADLYNEMVAVRRILVLADRKIVMNLYDQPLSGESHSPGVSCHSFLSELFSSVQRDRA